MVAPLTLARSCKHEPYASTLESVNIKKTRLSIKTREYSTGDSYREKQETSCKFWLRKAMSNYKKEITLPSKTSFPFLLSSAFLGGWSSLTLGVDMRNELVEMDG